MPGRKFRLLADLTPLRDSPAFRRLWIGSTLSQIGGGMTRFAVSLQVYEITRSSLAVGIIGLAQVVPTLTMGLAGGTFADSVDRRRLVLVTSSGLAVVTGALAAQSVAGLRAAWLLYVLVAIQAALIAVDAPARSTFLAGLLPRAQIPAGVALNRVIFQVSFTVSPALAGVITAAPHLGLRGCYLVDAVSFGGAIYGVARLPAMRPEVVTSRSLRAVRDGVRLIGRSQPLAGAFLADLAFTVLGLPVSLFPAINAARFHGDPRTLGLMSTAIGVGGLVGSVFSGPLRLVTRPGQAMLWTVGASGLAIMAFALTGSLWLTLAAFAAVGAADGFTVVFRGTIAQLATPDEYLGRVMAADYVVAAGGSQVGYLESGALAALTSPAISALSGGVACALAAVVIGVALPGLRRFRHQAPEGVVDQGGPERLGADEGTPEAEGITASPQTEAWCDCGG